MIISEELLEDLESMKVDEERNHVLTRITKTKKGVKKISSDHNVIISKFSIKWNRKKRAERIEMFNLKNRDCQKIFKEITSNTNCLSSAFSSSNNLNICTKKFIKNLNECIRRSFRKIRVTEKRNEVLEELFIKRRRLKSMNDPRSKDELDEIENTLAEMCAESNYNKIKEEIDNIKCDEGGMSSGHLWKLKKKLSPKCRDPPTAMLDTKGNLVTTLKQS